VALKSPTNGKTWLVIAGLGLSVLNFWIGWTAKRETVASEIATMEEKIRSFEDYRKEHTDNTTTPGMERLRKAELSLVEVQGRLALFERGIGELTALKADIVDIRFQLSEVRQTIRSARISGTRP
jgi:hypothetical protein